MTNLDSILKSRDFTLPTKVHLVNAMVFPVVMYGCERWTIKKAECQRIDAFELWCWRRLLRVPWTARRSNQSMLKEISPEYSLEGLMLKHKLQSFGNLMQRADTLEKTLCWERLKVGGEGDDRGCDGWMASLTQWTWVWVNSGSWWWTGGLACCGPWGHKESDTLSNWAELNTIFQYEVFLHFNIYSSFMNILKSFKRHCKLGFPGVTSGKETTCQCRYVTDAGLIHVLERSPEKEMPTHSSILAWEIPWRGTWQATVHGVIKHQTRLSAHTHMIYTILGSPGDSGGEESAWNAGDSLQFRRCSFIPWVRKIPWRREWHPTSVFLLGKFLGLRSLGGYSPWGHKKFDMMDQLMLSLSFFMYNSKLGAVCTFGFFLNM